MITSSEVLNFFHGKGDFFDLDINENDLARWFDEFLNVFEQRPFADNVGGIGPCPSAWLFLTAKILNPKLIIESGVWRGHSSWLLRQACPDAEMHSFDVNLSNLLQREKNVTYHEKDWSSHCFEHVDPKRSLLFFDDHVNQAMRVRESYERGFRFLIFDDNVSTDNGERAGLPPWPTIQMLFDASIAFGQKLFWPTNSGRTGSYKYLKRDVFGSRALIDKHYIYPATYCFLTFVKLINGATRPGS